MSAHTENTTNCKYCRWIRYNHDGAKWFHTCKLGKRIPMPWCADFEREPGSDDDIAAKT